MKRLRTNRMLSLLRRGARIAKTKTKPSDGMMYNLIYETLPNGWHYQVEYINDHRRNPNPQVVVYAFAPPRRMHARSADYFLEEAV